MRNPVPGAALTLWLFVEVSAVCHCCSSVGALKDRSAFVRDRSSPLGVVSRTLHAELHLKWTQLNIPTLHAAVARSTEDT